MSDPVARGLRNRAAMHDQDSPSTRARRRHAGFSMIEIVVALAIIAVMAAIGAPQLQQLVANQRVKSAARSIADAFLLARSEAIRTGNAHIVFLSADGSALDGSALGAEPRTGIWPALVVNDGGPGDWNCAIDDTDPAVGIPPETGVAWGYTIAGGARAPGDDNAADPASGVTFEYRGNPVAAVLFRGDGIPLTFDAACTLGTIGSGGGAVYVTNGARDYAVVLSPLGAVRVHAFNSGVDAWND